MDHQKYTQVALVTGAAQGLGKKIVECLYNAGYRVALTDRAYELAQEAARSIDASGEYVIPIKLDVANKLDFESALSEILDKWSELHVLVNNAAVTKSTPVMDITPSEFSEVVNINLGGTLFGCQIIGLYMKERNYGRIINMASLAGQNGGTATGAHYAASKGAIITLTKIFAKELAAHGVTVNAIAPGPVDSPMVRALIPEEKLESLITGIPIRKLGNDFFIGEMIVQIARNEAYFMTGSTIDINGGLYMR